MITQQQLIKLLTKYNFTENEKNEILNKKIKTLLKIGIYENIDSILEILINNGISKKTIKNCLSVLARGKVGEIEKTFKVLNEYNISKKTIENCLYVLAVGKAEEIEKIFKVLNENEISIENIKNNIGFLLQSNINEVNEIFSEGSQFLKRYMQLKGFYDKIMSREEVIQICIEKGISIDGFFRSIVKEDYIKLYTETFKQKGRIYLGKSIPIENKYMESNSEFLIELSKKVAKNFYYKYRIQDVSELESQALEIIITKCGDITYNFENNKEIVSRFIYSKVFKYLKRNFNKNEFLVDFAEREKFNVSNSSDSESRENGELDLSNWNINGYQKDILEIISMCLEEGQSISEATERVANILNVDMEEVLDEIENIKLMNSKDLIRKGER